MARHWQFLERPAATLTRYIRKTSHESRIFAACVAKVTREGISSATAVVHDKAGIEACHLRHIGHSFGDSFDGC
jgi:hypothetical protein